MVNKTMNNLRRGEAWIWAVVIAGAFLVCALIFALFIGVPRYELVDVIRFAEISPDAAHYPVPIPGDETLCAGNVTITCENPVALEDGMTYTQFASGDGSCAYKTQV